MGDPGAQPSELLDELARIGGIRWEVVGRLAGGFQSGASELRSSSGDRAVLKVTTDAAWADRVLAAAPVVARVRASGYPTPEWRAHGRWGEEAWVVQSWVEGHPLDIRSTQAPELLGELIDTQRDLDPEPTRNWSEYVLEVVLGDRADELRRTGVEGRELVDALRSCLRGRREPVLPSDDLVHGDLSPGNVLVFEGRVTGAVDVEALGSGTRVIDWATALRSAWTEEAPPEVVEDLTRRAAAVAGEDVLAVCVAAASIELLLFHLRRENTSLAHDAKRLCALAADLASRR